MRRWFRHFVFGALAAYMALLVVAFSPPKHASWELGRFRLGEIKGIACIVVGAAWASAYTMWRYARVRDVP